MSEKETAVTVPNKHEKKENRKRIAKLAVKGRGNRYYGFRNIGRLKSLQKFKLLFGILSGLSVLVLCGGLAVFGVWFVLNAITLFLLLNKFTVILNYGVYVTVIGAGIFVLSLLLRILIERTYFAAEKRELKNVPDGADKYLAILRVNAKSDWINLGMWAIVIAAIAIGASIDLKNKFVISAIVAVTLIVLIISRVVSGHLYNKVSKEIEDVKAERRTNKETFTNF